MTRPSDSFDELAAMFLTEPDEAEEGPTRTPRRAAVELLMIGHLPVRGGLWLTPYADALARELGPTTLMRLDDEETSLQLLRGEPAALSPLVQQPQPTLPETIRSLGPAVNMWVIRPPADAGLEQYIQAGADRITILSSADQAAVVAAYQLVKNLAEEAGQLQRPLPEIGVAILGAEPAAAASMLDRLCHTTLECLCVPVSLVTCLGKMDAGIRSTGYLRFTGRPSPALSDIVRWISHSRAVAARAPAAEPQIAEHEAATPPPVATAPPDVPAELPLPPRTPRAARPVRLQPGVARFAQTPSRPNTVEVDEFPEAPAAGLPPEHHVPPAAPTHSANWAPPENKWAATEAEAATAVPPRTGPGRSRLTPPTAASVEPKRPAGPAEPQRDDQPPSLADHVAGLTALPVRCPGHERVELAVDQAGALHLLGRENALRALHSVESWAVAHAGILAMACPDKPINPAARPICHVFTDTPATLTDLQGSELHLHVLAPVEVEGRRGWYAAPLNQPRR